MSLSARVLLVAIYTVGALLMESFFLWLFPYTGLGGLVCWPFTLVISIVFGFILFRLSLRLRLKPLVLVSISVFAIQGILQLYMLPQDFGGTTLSKIARSAEAWRQYDDLQYQQLPQLQGSKRVAYIYKFKQQLPDSLVIIYIDSALSDYELITLRSYMVEFRSGQKLYDSSRLEIVESDTATLLTEKLPGAALTHVQMVRFLNGGSGRSEDNYVLYAEKETFRLKTGIEKMLLAILSCTKSPVTK